MKLTKIGIALVAVLAMSGLAASAASAVTFNSSSSPVMLYAPQAEGGKHKLTVDGQGVECGNVTLEKVSQTTPANEITGVTASYNECTAFGMAATVYMGTCTFALTDKISFRCNNNANVNTLPNNGNTRAVASVFGSECEIHVAEQNDKQTISYSNDTPLTGKVQVGLSVNNITVNKTKDNGLCALAGTGITNNAFYNGTTNVEATGGASIAVF